jgi:hypothetical protein
MPADQVDRLIDVLTVTRHELTPPTPVGMVKA